MSAAPTWVSRRWSAHGGIRATLPRLTALVAYLLAVVVLLSHPRQDGPKAANEGMNVVLLGIDALRPDHLGSEGYFRDTAPAIDAFLSESVVFEEAFTPLARTYPSWTSLLTGSWPTTPPVRAGQAGTEILIKIYFWTGTRRCTLGFQAAHDTPIFKKSIF